MLVPQKKKKRPKTYLDMSWKHRYWVALESQENSGGKEREGDQDKINPKDLADGIGKGWQHK